MFNVPNLLSISRLVFLPLLFYLLHCQSRLSFIIAYAIIGSTDLWDGMIARRFNLVTDLGKTLDSVADLVFYIASAYFLYILSPAAIVANRIPLICFFSLLGLSFIISAIKLKKPVLMHTALLRLNAVLVYLVVIASQLTDTRYFVTAVLIIYYIAFTEEILIFLIYGDVDPDTRWIFHLRSKS
jgi:CDP-diacylglycerol--glycerol-3-phosphate 3-phosphatidyltransferase